MWRGDNFIEQQQRMIRCRRFVNKDIKSRARNCPRLDRVVKCALINQPTASAVDDSHALLHPRKSVATDHAARLRSQRRVDSNEICARKKFVKRRQFDLRVARLLRRDEGIKRNYLHAKRARAGRHGPSDSAHADDAERLAL